MNILILGATSAIARVTALEFAAQGHNLYLASRDSDELARITTDLSSRFPINVQYGQFDAEDFTAHAAFLLRVIAAMEKLDGVLLAFGDMKDAQPVEIINRNLTGAISILGYCSEYFIAQKSGFIIGISSVAGDRGRRKNKIYGAAKAGLSTYLQALRNELFFHGIRVITIKPGFVDTPMTYGLKGMFCVAKPEYVGKRIVASINKLSDIVYLPWFWRYIMLIIKWMPEWLFKRVRW